MAGFEIKATLNLTETAEQLVIVKKLAKQLNDEIQKLELQIEREKALLPERARSLKKELN